MLEYEGRPLKLFWIYPRKEPTKKCESCKGPYSHWSTCYDQEKGVPIELRMNNCWSCTLAFLESQGWTLKKTENHPLHCFTTCFVTK